MKIVMFPPDHFCMDKGFTLDPHMVTSTLSSILQMVQSGVGAYVLPRLLLDNLHHKDIKVLHLRNPTPSQDICLIYRSDRYVGYAIRTFIKTLRTYFETAINQAKSS